MEAVEKRSIDCITAGVVGANLSINIALYHFLQCDIYASTRNANSIATTRSAITCSPCLHITYGKTKSEIFALRHMHLMNNSNPELRHWALSAAARILH
jgi:hypothetical protein